jgi:hypothetical protein
MTFEPERLRRTSYSLSPCAPPGQQLPQRLPDLALSYGQVMWLLLNLGYGAGVPESTFHEYLKSLRKLGIPFKRTSNRRKRLRYLYYHIMELALILSLRVYHVVPDSVLREIVRHRKQLFLLYRSAYAQRASGRGKAIDLAAVSGKQIQLRGLFIDLRIGFAGGQLINFGPPRLLSPADALIQFAKRTETGEFLLPLNLSLLAERVVALAVSPPRKRRPTPPSKVRFPGLSLGLHGRRSRTIAKKGSRGPSLE